MVEAITIDVRQAAAFADAYNRLLEALETPMYDGRDIVDSLAERDSRLTAAAIYAAAVLQAYVLCRIAAKTATAAEATATVVTG